MIINFYIQGKQEQASFTELAATVELAQQSQGHIEETLEDPQYTKYAILYAENSDFEAGCISTIPI
ncbi:hypothetical protein [Extibacter muris]|uniref:Uncharacterized protein n=1 Tax=Extibacter muris TaxID=1796622 RepID=A0A4V2WSC3_9FIRM|nr:hypothetical protein [Extibacter muris]MCU0080780.1 hypothetical protein [Extibacter muris]TDA21030.1 hypothetical protein E1963_13860 [Extibacter muris]